MRHDNTLSYCHIVFNVPRGAWRCLVCRYRDNEFLKRKSSRGDKRKLPITADTTTCLSDEQLNGIFTIDRAGTLPTDISSAEESFEVLSAPLKAKLLHAELTNRAKSLINTSLSTIRTAEHSIRAFTETSKARKGLMERIENMGLPQELIQCFTRIAQSKMRIKDLIRGVESAIKTRQHHDPSDNVEEGIDAVIELMDWYLSQKEKKNDPELYNHLFPEGPRTLSRRRVEPRTDEAKGETDDASNSSGVSLDNLRCACCLESNASDENDLLLCDGLGCYRAFHMQCLQPKLTPGEVATDDNEHWFCPFCTAHGELIHFAHREFLGDEFFGGSPPKEWETARDVFPEANFEMAVAQKLKGGIRDEGVNQFLSEHLGIHLASTQSNNASTEYQEDEDDESDEDFESDEEEVAVGSDSEDSLEEERRLVQETIDKDELDALSVGSTDDDVDSDGGGAVNKPGRRMMRTRKSARQSRDHSSCDDEDSDSSEDKPDVGTLDTANM